MAPHTILFIAANPVGTDRRALDEQARTIQVELERASCRDCFKFETRWAAQPLDLLREMVKHKPTVVHFCGGRVIGGGKGAPPAGVYFQAADGRAQRVPAKALASAFDAAGSVKLVVLDACYSEEVPPLELEPARTLLRVIVGHEVAGADELLGSLGGHVLSIEFAATYMREYGTSPAEYLQQLASGKDRSSSVVDQTSYRATAESAFRLLWNRVAPDVRHAWVLAAQLPHAWFSSELAEAIGLNAERRRALVRLHLLDRDHQGRHQMHRLLREFALAEEPSTSVQQTVILGATELLETGDDALTFQRYRRDADSFAHLVADSANTPANARFLAVCGRGLRQLGELAAARQLLEQALASDLKTYGEDHPWVAAGRNNLASVLKDLGELAAARQLLEQALASDLRTYGEDHPNVARDRRNLALVRQALGEPPVAADEI